MTISEITARIEQVQNEIRICENSLGSINPFTAESYKEYFKGDWEVKKVGGSIRDTSSERENLENRLKSLKSELVSLQGTLRWKEQQLEKEFMAKRTAAEREKRMEARETFEENRLREQKEMLWQERKDVWNQKSSLYRFFHMRKNPSKIYQNLDSFSVEKLEGLYR